MMFSVTGKIVLPAGCNVFISPFATHRLPDIYPDPLKYNPDRFSPENSHKIHPYAYLPFSIGPRNCIGNSLLLSTLYQLYLHILVNLIVLGTILTLSNALNWVTSIYILY